MLRVLRCFPGITLLALFTLPVQANAGPPQVNFNRDIRPILSRNCFHCHGPDAEHREADLRLDQETGLKSTSESAIIHPGQPDQSELFARISSHDADTVMPPADSGKKLTSEEIELFKQTWNNTYKVVHSLLSN